MICLWPNPVGVANYPDVGAHTRTCTYMVLVWRGGSQQYGPNEGRATLKRIRGWGAMRCACAGNDDDGEPGLINHQANHHTHCERVSRDPVRSRPNWISCCCCCFEKCSGLISPRYDATEYGRCVLYLDAADKTTDIYKHIQYIVYMYIHMYWYICVSVHTWHIKDMFAVP